MVRILSIRTKERLKNYSLILLLITSAYMIWYSVRDRSNVSDKFERFAIQDGGEEVRHFGQEDQVFNIQAATTTQSADENSKHLEEDQQERLMEQQHEEEEKRKEEELERQRLEEQRMLEEVKRRQEEEERIKQEEARQLEEARQQEEARKQEAEMEERRRQEAEERRRQEEQQNKDMGHDDYVKPDDNQFVADDNKIGGPDDAADTEKHVKIYTRDYIHSFERFRVGEAKIEFLDNFKSPCWLEDNDDPFPYTESRLLTGPKYMKKSCFSDGLKKSKPTMVQLPGQDKPYRVRCLPYFMLLGMAKSGTSDFQSRILNSNYIFKGFSKELYWWDQYRFDPNATLSDYSDLFDFAIKDMIKIEEKDGQGNPYWPGLVGEMTTITLPDVAYWRDDPRNAGSKEPKFFTPHDVHALIPNVKLIVLMRNPVSRLYSHYNMWAPLRGYPKSPEDFHMRVVNSMKWWEDCLKILPLRGCLYGSPPEMPEVEHTLSSWWPTNANHSGEFRNGMYYLFLKDWFEVFPRESFLFLRSEDYNIDKLKTMNEEVYPFLGIPPVEGAQADKVENAPNAFQVEYDPMLPETKEILSKLYQPYNDKLAELLGEERWAWRS